LVERLKRKGIRNQAVLDALETVPRHLFLDPEQFDNAYVDTALPIGHAQTISQPFVVALMSEMLLTATKKNQRVLEIGTGCGYQTAILSHLFDKVYSVERILSLSQKAGANLESLCINNVTLQHGDGTTGWPGQETFDAIIVTAASDNLPQPLLALLEADTCLIAPIGAPGHQQLTTLRNQNGLISSKTTEAVRFVPLLSGICD
jgi:protein-L-isoaspartate(D-aspartate) O-methyltransferase